MAARSGTTSSPAAPLPGSVTGTSERTRTGLTTAGAADRDAALHVYSVETLYAAEVYGYIDWQTAIVEAVLRASLSGDKATHSRACCSSQTPIGGAGAGPANAEHLSVGGAATTG